MEAAIRVISVERGSDPRHFILAAFGGAGPLHACELATALQIPRVFIPKAPGVLSALGMLAADIIKDYVRTIMVHSQEAHETVKKAFSELEEQGRAELAQEGFSSEQVTIEPLLDLRYVGQSYELTVPFEGDVERAVTHFHAAHEKRFGYNDPRERVQVVNVRMKARGTATRPVLERQEENKGASAMPAETRPVVFAGPEGATTHDTAVYEREKLVPGVTIKGPAIVTQYDTTTVLPPEWQAHIDAIGNLIAERVKEEEHER
jgi:N-methylhydantoinase A